MMTEMDDCMVLESNLAARAREKQEAVSKNVVGMASSAPALTLSPVGDDMNKHGAAQEEDLALSMKPSGGGAARELPFESSTFSSPISGNFHDNADEEPAVVQKKRRKRGKDWVEEDTDDLLSAVLNTTKGRHRMEQGSDSDSYWDAVAKAVPGRTGLECQGRMDTLKRYFSTTKEYCDGHRKEFKELSDEDFKAMKVSPLFTEAWYNQIRDSCPPSPKKKSKTNGAGSSSQSTGFVPDTSALGLEPSVQPDGIDRGESALVASGPVTQPMEDPPACLEFQLAGPSQEQGPPLVPQDADVEEDFVGSLLASFEYGSFPPWE